MINSIENYNWETRGFGNNSAAAASKSQSIEFESVCTFETGYSVLQTWISCKTLDLEEPVLMTSESGVAWRNGRERVMRDAMILKKLEKDEII